MGWFDTLCEQPRQSLYKYYKIIKIRKNASNYQIKKTTFKYLFKITVKSCPAFFDYQKWNDKYRIYANAQNQLLRFSNSERRKNYKNEFDYYKDGIVYFSPFYNIDSGLRIAPNLLKNPAKYIAEIIKKYEAPPFANFL